MDSRAHEVLITNSVVVSYRVNAETSFTTSSSFSELQRYVQCKKACSSLLPRSEWIQFDECSSVRKVGVRIEEARFRAQPHSVLTRKDVRSRIEFAVSMDAWPRTVGARKVHEAAVGLPR